MRLPAEHLVERFGSPLHVLDGDVIRARWRRLRAAMPSCVDIHYAMKANPALGVLALLRSEGANVEIASEGELLAARRAGFEGRRILFAGPGKTDRELEAASAASLRAIHVESEGELLRLDAIGRRRGEPVRAGLRVHVPWGATEGHRIIGGSGITKFGIPEAEALRGAREWTRLEGVRLIGLHVFNASNVLDAGALASGAARTASLGLRLLELGLPLEHVDVGGGLGVPHAPGERELDVEELGEALAPLGERFRLMVEPGRWLVAEAGRYFVQVVDAKTSEGMAFLACDGGIHHLLRPALIGQPHPVRRAHAPGQSRASAEGPLARYEVVGPLCTSLDTFGAHDLPETRVGDLLEIGVTGAYGFTEAMPMFLSHAVPAEILLLDGQAHVLRRRREAKEHLDGQSIPPMLEVPGS